MAINQYLLLNFAEKTSIDKAIETVGGSSGKDVILHIAKETTIKDARSMLISSDKTQLQVRAEIREEFAERAENCKREVADNEQLVKVQAELQAMKTEKEAKEKADKEILAKQKAFTLKETKARTKAEKALKVAKEKAEQKALKEQKSEKSA